MWFLLFVLMLVSATSCGGLAAPAPAPIPDPSPLPASSEIRLWQDAQIFEVVAAEIKAAGAVRARVWVEMYEFEREDLAALMESAHAAGSDVRLLLDPSVAASFKLGTRLRSMGLPVRFYPIDDRVHQIDHVKLLLTGTAALVGGMNWGRRSHLNHDYVLAGRDPPLLSRLGTIFEQDWNLAGGLPSPLPESASAAAQTAPGEEVRRLLLADLNAARREVKAEVFVLTDHEVLAGLVAAARRGASVRVLLDPHQDVNRPGFELLRQSGVGVRWFPIPAGAKLHAKTGLFDARLIVGSANWSRGGLSINHELDLETVEPAVVAIYRARFDADWSRSPGCAKPRPVPWAQLSAQRRRAVIESAGMRESLLVKTGS